MIVRREGRRGWLVGVAAVLVSASPVDARTCGGDVACGCGDTVRGVAVLTQDLEGCAEDGLRLKDDAVLECDGHGISGRGKGEGVLLDQARGAIVRHCRISGFKTGIRIRGGEGNEVAASRVSSNGRYGIELAKATTGNRLVDNWIADSGDEGIHIGTGAHGTEVVGNEIHGSDKENLYVLSSDLGIFRDNLLTGSGAAAIYVKHSSENVFEGNRVFDHSVHVRGHAQRNRFEENRVDGGRFIFDAYRDRHPAAVRGWTRPSDNLVVGGAVLGTKTCFQFKGSSDNQAIDVVSDGCKPRKQSKKGGRKSKRNDVSLLPVADSDA